MSNQYLGISGVNPVTVDSNTAAISLAPAAQGQKMYYDGANWQFRAEYGDHDFVVGTQTGDYASVQACLNAAPIVFPATTSTIKIYIKNSVTEPGALVVPANCRALITIGPGVTYSTTNTITLTEGSATDNTSLLFVGQAPESSTFSWDRPDGEYCFTKTGSNRVRLEMRSLRVLKAQVVNPNSFALLFNPFLTATVRQEFDRVTFLTGGDGQQYLGNDIANDIYAPLDMRITRCTFNSAINPVTGIISTFSSFIACTINTSYLYVDDLTIIHASPSPNSAIVVVDSTPGVVFKNIRIANDALNSGITSSVRYAGKILDNFYEFDTGGISNVLLNFLGVGTPPLSACYSNIECSAVQFARIDAGDYVGGSFQNINCRDFTLASTIVSPQACLGCSFDNVNCRTLDIQANFGLTKCTWTNLRVTSTCNPLEASVNECVFINPFIGDTTNGLRCNATLCKFINITCNGNLSLIRANRCTITDSGGPNFATVLNVGNNGNTISYISNISCAVSLFDDFAGNPPALTTFESITSSNVFSENTIDPDSTALILNCRFSRYNITRTGGGLGTDIFVNCFATDPLLISGFAGPGTAILNCFFAHTVEVSGGRPLIRGLQNNNFVGTAIVLDGCNYGVVESCAVFSTQFLEVNNTDFLIVNNNMCGGLGANIVFNDVAGNNYTCTNNICNTIVFQPGQTKTIASNNNVTVPLAVAPTVVPGANG